MTIDGAADRSDVPVDFKISIVYENDEFWILDKAPGISINDERLPNTWPEQDSNETTRLRPGLITLFKQELGVSRAHPVHRLDKETSGLLVVAKTARSNQALSHAFQKQEIKKTYIAITRTKKGATPKKKQGWIKGDMKPSRGGNWVLLKTLDKPAITQFFSHSLSDRRRLCLLSPQSGKTHQLRVAMKALSMPICGDTRYGGDDSDRLYLHAYRIQFELFSQVYRYTLLPQEHGLFSGGEFKRALKQLDSQ